MSIKVIIGIVLVTFAIIAGLVWLGRPTTNQVNTVSSPSFVKSDNYVFNFGAISMGKGKVNHQFKVTNSSGKSLTLNKINTSCMCTSANFQIGQKTFGPFGMEGMGGLTYANITLNPGDSGVVEVTYDPAAHGPAGVGSIDRFIYLNDTDGGQLQLEIKAFVTP